MYFTKKIAALRSTQKVALVEKQIRDRVSQFRNNVVAAGLLAVALCGTVTNLEPKDSHLVLMIIRVTQTQILEKKRFVFYY